MNAPERVLKAINHEEPDRIPAFETIITSKTLMIHYGVLKKDKALKNLPTSNKSPSRKRLSHYLLAGSC